MKSSYLTTKFLGSYGYDFRDQDAPDYSANGTYSAVGNILIYRHLLILYIYTSVVFNIFNNIIRWYFFQLLFAKRANEIIKDHKKNHSRKPMFLYLPFQNVHWPYQVPKKYERMYPNIKHRLRRIFSGM